MRGQEEGTEKKRKKKTDKEKEERNAKVCTSPHTPMITSPAFYIPERVTHPACQRSFQRVNFIRRCSTDLSPRIYAIIVTLRKKIYLRAFFLWIIRSEVHLLVPKPEQHFRRWKSTAKCVRSPGPDQWNSLARCPTFFTFVRNTARKKNETKPPNCDESFIFLLIYWKTKFFEKNSIPRLLVK